ncbi:GGDEF domain-containing protein [Rhodococcus sp. 14-2470-1a]|uniref:GGDEF domain-containing protein n=1 Tax=Rhodococcus sp. 14-2470-1a TaxID=2023150 RepID=UPI000BD07D4B|nr:GGDEF domain-containing protein [Rhodococcus sp. 14-2470-1a]OZF42057.1 hypothetical protein CH292_26530 [Rhodococcus sp. 14-2470-1a]
MPEENEVVQHLVDCIPMAAIAHDSRFKLLAVNSECRSRSNLSGTYAISRDARQFLHPSEHPAAEELSLRLLDEWTTSNKYPSPVSALRRLQQDNGPTISVWTHVGITVANGEPVFVVCLDLAAPLLAEISTLRERAERDDLTGLLRRIPAMEQVDQWLHEECPVSVVFADLDNFKDVNDTYGHAAGDFVLRKVAIRLGALAHENRIVCRYAGDELLVVERSVEQSRPFEWRFDSHRFVKSFVNESALAPIRWRGQELRISISVGHAQSRPGDTVDRLMERADAAMYEAKRSTVRISENN